MPNRSLLLPVRIALATGLMALIMVWLLLSPRNSLATAPLATPLHARLAGQYPGGNARSVAVGNNGYVYVGFGSFFTALNVANPGAIPPPASVNLGSNIEDIAILPPYAYVVGGSDLHVIDISTPAFPQQRGNVYAGNPSSVALYASQYVNVGDTSGYAQLRVFNASTPNAPVQVSSYGEYTSPNYPIGMTMHYGLAFVADDTNGVQIVDTFPPTPEGVSSFYVPGSAKDVAGYDNYVCVANGGYGVRIFDIHNLSQPTEVGLCDTPGDAQGVAVAAFHNIYYAFVADGAGGLRILDISTPSSPYETGFYDTSGSALDVAVAGSYAYVADGAGGLVILELYVPTPTPTVTATQPPTHTDTPTPTPTSTPVASPTATPTFTATVDPWISPTPTATFDPALSPTPTTTKPVGEPATIYLPLSLKNHVTYFEGPWEHEPNNDYLHANGPLRFGRVYQSYPYDAKDYFSLYLPGDGKLTIDLADFSAFGAQMLLYDRIPVINGEVARAYTEPYRIEYTGKAGLYYLYIYAASGYNSSNPYTLEVMYIPAELSRQSSSGVVRLPTYLAALPTPPLP